MNDVKTPKEIFEDRATGQRIQNVTLDNEGFPETEQIYKRYAIISVASAYLFHKAFKSNVELKECYFPRTLIGSEVEFEHYLSFEKSVFEENFNADYFHTKGQITFESVIFNGEVELNGCHFYKSVNFNKAEFRQTLRISKSTFYQDCDFSFVAISGLLTIEDCVFEGKVNFAETNFSHVHIENCSFKQRVDFSSRQERKTIQQITIHNTNFNEEVVFYSRTFKKANFHAVTFNGVADFYDTCFEQPVNFAKTKFLDTCSFVKARFNGIAVFNLTVIGRNMVLRDTCFEQGVNLATIDFVGEGTINSFGVNIKPFTADKDAQDINLNDNWEKISQQHIRETYRILKHESIKQNNKIQALEYHAEEMDSFLSELRNKGLKWYENDRFVTEFNRLSNYYGLSWRRGLGWLLSISILGFILYWISLSTPRPVVFSLNTTLIETWKSIGQVFGYYLQFTNPAHNIEFMEEHAGSWSYVVDIVVRLFVGLVIYQTIQAFRKYGRF